MLELEGPTEGILGLHGRRYTMSAGVGEDGSMGKPNGGLSQEKEGEM